MTYPTPDAAGSDTPDFTVNRDPHCFTIAPDRFCAPAIISSVILRKLANLHASLSMAPNGNESETDRVMKALADMFRLLLPGASGRLFAERLLSDGDPGDPEADPPVPASPPVIDLAREAMPAMNWLLERYGMRPTMPSSPSLDGLTAASMNGQSDITSSTAGASIEASGSAN
jgi:hypothetical protein